MPSSTTLNKKPNVILITIDSLRADHLGFMGYEKKITPNIDKLAKESIVFTQAFSTAPVTLQSFISILTSTYPLDYQGPRKIEKPRVLISEVLKKQGFITAVFHCNVFLSNYFGYNKGWDFFEDFSSFNDIFPAKLVNRKFLKSFKKIIFAFFILFFPDLSSKIKKLKHKLLTNLVELDKFEFNINASHLNQTIKDFVCAVKNKNIPFFILAHYMDVHAPYFSKKHCYRKETHYSFLKYLLHYQILVRRRRALPRRALRRALPQSLIEKIKKLIFKKMDIIKENIKFYDFAIEYLDEQLGELIEFLKKENLYDNSVIILTADHGEEFLEHGFIIHSSRLYNELLHVPLAMKVPSSRTQIIKRKVSLIDLAPIICDLLKIKKPPSFKGKNLLKPSNSPIFHQTAENKTGNNDLIMPAEIKKINQCVMACQFDNWKYIFDYSTQKEELFDLIKDPREQKNLSHSNPEILFKMRDIMEEFLRKNQPLSLVAKKH